MWPFPSLPLVVPTLLLLLELPPGLNVVGEHLVYIMIIN